MERWSISELLEQLIQRAQALSTEEKALFADRLLVDSQAVDPAWEAAWAEECERRAAALVSGATTAVPWEEARQRLFGG